MTRAPIRDARGTRAVAHPPARRTSCVSQRRGRPRLHRGTAGPRIAATADASTLSAGRVIRGDGSRHLRVRGVGRRVGCFRGTYARAVRGSARLCERLGSVPAVVTRRAGRDPGGRRSDRTHAPRYGRHPELVAASARARATGGHRAGGDRSTDRSRHRLFEPRRRCDARRTFRTSGRAGARDVERARSGDARRREAGRRARAGGLRRAGRRLPQLHLRVRRATDGRSRFAARRRARAAHARSVGGARGRRDRHLVGRRRDRAGDRAGRDRGRQRGRAAGAVGRRSGRMCDRAGRARRGRAGSRAGGVRLLRAEHAVPARGRAVGRGPHRRHPGDRRRGGRCAPLAAFEAAGLTHFLAAPYSVEGASWKATAEALARITAG